MPIKQVWIDLEQVESTIETSWTRDYMKFQFSDPNHKGLLKFWWEVSNPASNMTEGLGRALEFALANQIVDRKRLYTIRIAYRYEYKEVVKKDERGNKITEEVFVKAVDIGGIELTFTEGGSIWMSDPPQE